MEKNLTFDEAMPLINEKLKNNAQVSFTPRGISMRPMLIGGRSEVTISKVKAPLKKNDVVLYRRKNGSYVLHRIIGTDNGEFQMCGDNQTTPETGVLQTDIIGVLTEFKRKKRNIAADSFLYKLYGRIWVHLMPFRRFMCAVKFKIGKIREK